MQPTTFGSVQMQFSVLFCAKSIGFSEFHSVVLWIKCKSKNRVFIQCSQQLQNAYLEAYIKCYISRFMRIELKRNIDIY